MKVKVISGLFQKELKDKYPEAEIGNFVFLVLRALLGFSKIDEVLRKEEDIDEKNIPVIKYVLEKLKKDFPIQYILGTADFYGLLFKVNTDVLIPRLETEELVDLIIKENRNAKAVILDIGTGSGCIAVSLKKNIPESSVYAIDISEKALSVAKENAKINKTEIDFSKCNILNQEENNFLPDFDIIVSNPPYVMESEKIIMRSNVTDHEPHIALFVPDEDPLLFYHAIAEFSKKHLKPRGFLYFEINERFAIELTKSLTDIGFSNVTCFKDIHNKDRILKCSNVV